MLKRRQTHEAGGRAFRAGPAPQRTPLRDNLEYIAALLLIVLLLRQMVVEAFRIQHGSMAPTLLGVHKEVRCENCGWVFSDGFDKVPIDGSVECPNCGYVWPGAPLTQDGLPIAFRQPSWLWNTAVAQDGTVITGTDAANRVNRGASRIFVNKFIYNLRKPRRWEVVVFLFHYQDVRCKDCGWRGQVESVKDLKCPDCGGTRFDVTSRNFIKRLAGLPGESIELKDGDVYVDGTLARKPPRVQERLWMPVFDSRFVPRREVQPTWDLGTRPQLWRRTAEGARLSVDARGSPEPVMASFGRPVVDFYPYDGLSYDNAQGRLGAAGRNEVGDVRIRARVRVLDHGPDAAVLLGIRDAGRAFTMALDAGGSGGATLQDGPQTISRHAAPPLRLHKSVWIELENYDDRIVGRVDGRQVLSLDYRAAGRGPHQISFGAQGASVVWERIVIERDVYYTALDGRNGEPTRRYQMGPDEYFVLGDNSPASSDSRRWPRPGVPGRNLIGKAFFVFWPIHQAKRL